MNTFRGLRSNAATVTTARSANGSFLQSHPSGKPMSVFASVQWAETNRKKRLRSWPPELRRDMDELRPKRPLRDLDHSGAACAEILNIAKRELGAFMAAIEEVYGFEQARLSGEDWLEELESMSSVPGSALRDWRLVTIAAAARLATRIVDARHNHLAVPWLV